MPTFLQGAQNFQAPYVSGAITKTLSKNVTAGSLLAVTAWWFEINSGPTPTGMANFTITDNHNSYTPASNQQFTQVGFRQKLQVSYVPAAASGSTTISVSADQPGCLFFTVHEVAPDAGLVWVFNGASGGNSSAHQDTGELDIGVGFEVEGGYNSFNNYSFLAAGTMGGSTLPSVPTPPYKNEQFVANPTPISNGTPIPYQGTLSTWDGVNLSTLNFPVFCGPNSFLALGETIVFSLIVPSCDAPTASPTPGTYTGTQSVTLSQDQGKPMFYTLDGSTPTTSSTSYSGAISVPHSLQLKVLAHDSSMTLADTVTTFNYSIVPTPPAGASILIQWERRTRIGGAWLDGSGTVPLSEEAELYDLEIYSLDGTTLKRTINGLTTNQYDYTSSLQFTDFGGYIPYAYVKVYQVSATVGRGFPAVNPTAGADGRT